MLTDLDAEIAQAQERLAELERLRAEAESRVTELTRLRSARGIAAGAADCEGCKRSPASKLELFRGLFIGRNDVFAVRWESRARGRSGYAPRCANEWRPGICGKPKVRCGSCTNQAFVSLDERELLAHLRGHQIVGIYPLLADDTCRLLAIDLDGKSRMEGIFYMTPPSAFVTHCRDFVKLPSVVRGKICLFWYPFGTRFRPQGHGRRRREIPWVCGRDR